MAAWWASSRTRTAGGRLSTTSSPTPAQFVHRYSGARVELQQQHRIHAQCGDLQRREPDLDRAEEPDGGAEPGQRDHAGAAHRSCRASTSFTRRLPATTRTRTAKRDRMNGDYREHALEGASAVDLVVALYDGIIRFLYAAIAAVERGDADGAPGRGEARAGHHHSPAGAAANGCRRPPGAGAQRVLRRDLCADPAGLAVGVHGRNSSTPSIVCATCAMPGARWQRIRMPILPRRSSSTFRPAPIAADRSQTASGSSDRIATA